LARRQRPHVVGQGAALRTGSPALVEVEQDLVDDAHLYFNTYQPRLPADNTIIAKPSHRHGLRGRGTGVSAAALRTCAGDTCCTPSPYASSMALCEITLIRRGTPPLKR